MKRLRKALSLLLGAVLLVQGYALSAAPLPADTSKPVASLAADMPCHGAADQTADNADAACCGSDCPDMTACLLGQLAVTACFAFEPSRAPGERPDAGPSTLLIQPPAALLRPPIALHG
ncbi:MAG TPA: hypothetical protein VNJ47_06690 [Nevskiales bacterium]|nr:hypothetical protein [Nevskiales bacterium]